MLLRPIPAQASAPVDLSNKITLLEMSQSDLVERITLGFLAQHQENTRKAYRLDLALWFRFLDKNDTDPFEVTRAHIEIWMRSEEKRGLKSSSIYRRVNTVKLWYRYAFEEDFIGDDPGKRVRLPKVHYEEDMPYLDRWDMAEFIRAASQHPREEALGLISILGMNGLRISEALNLNVDSLCRIDGYWALNIIRKGKKPGSVPVSADVHSAISPLLKKYEEGALLRNCEGRRMTRRNAHDLINRIKENTPITKHVTPHTFRRSFISIGLDAGVSLSDMALSVGHESVLTTVRYDKRRRHMSRNGTHVVTQQIAAAMRA